MIVKVYYNKKYQFCIYYQQNMQYICPSRCQRLISLVGCYSSTKMQHTLCGDRGQPWATTLDQAAPDSNAGSDKALCVKLGRGAGT